MSETIQQGPTQKSLGWRLFTIFLGVILALVLAWGGHLGWHAFHLLRLAHSLQADPTQIRPETLVSLVEEAAGDVGAIHQDLSPLFPVFDALQGLPWAGPYLGQVEPLVRYADGLVQAGKEVGMGLEPLLKVPPAGQAALPLPQLASQVLQSGQAQFVQAAEDVNQASQVRSRIRPELLPASVRPLYLKLDGKFDLLVAGIQVLQAAPRLLGAGQAQSYLVLAENRDEERATGGFISGIGLLTLQEGKIMQFDLGYQQLGEGDFDLRSLYYFRERVSRYMQEKGINLIEKAFEQVTDQQIKAYCFLTLKTGSPANYVKIVT